MVKAPLSTFLAYSSGSVIFFRTQLAVVAFHSMISEYSVATELVMGSSEDLKNSSSPAAAQ